MSDDDDDFLKTMEEMEELCADETVIERSLDAGKDRTIGNAEESKVEKSSSTAGDETTICARTRPTKAVDVNSTDDEDDVLGQMDSFLEESNNLRDGTFIDSADFVASTPARPTAKSRLSEFQFSKEEVKRMLTKSLQQHDNNPAADGNTSTDVPQSKSDDTVKAEDTSVLLSGNLGPLNDKELLDHSLLDAEDDDDDDFEESTLDQLLQHSLLDSDEEEEEDSDSTLDKTLVAAPDPPEPAAARLPAPPPVGVPEVKKPETKADAKKTLSKADVKKIINNYYNELVKYYESYRNSAKHSNQIGPVPPMQAIRYPRIFYDRDKKNIIGYEDLAEYLDNNHPLWFSYQDFYMKYLHGYKTDEDFSQFVHNKWNSGHNIDINQNLSTFPRLNWTDHKRENLLREKSSLQTNDSLNATSSKAHVQAMLEGTHKTSHIHEKEEARIKKYESNAEVDNEDEGSQTNVHCEYCQNFCTCYIDRTKGKRKRSSSGGGSMRKQPRYMKMPDLQDAVVENFYRQGVQRCFDILKSAEEARAFSCCYIKQSQPNQEMVKELLSLETVYDGFEDYYASPYARDNKPKPPPRPLTSASFLEDY